DEPAEPGRVGDQRGGVDLLGEQPLERSPRQDPAQVRLLPQRLELGQQRVRVGREALPVVGRGGRRGGQVAGDRLVGRVVAELGGLRRARAPGEERERHCQDRGEDPGPRAAHQPLRWCSSPVTTLPSALPLVAFITWPTKKPVILASPSQKRCHSSGWAAMSSSTIASSWEVSIASNPCAAAISAGAPPFSTISASTVLAWVAVSLPSTSMVTSSANAAGSSPVARSSARLCSAWVSVRAGS